VRDQDDERPGVLTKEISKQYTYRFLLVFISRKSVIDIFIISTKHETTTNIYDSLTDFLFA